MVNQQRHNTTAMHKPVKPCKLHIERRLRAGVRKQATRDVHKTGGGKWSDEFLWRLGADYRFR